MYKDVSGTVIEQLSDISGTEFEPTIPVCRLTQTVRPPGSANFIATELTLYTRGML
jgi:hypothetical protein